MAMASTAVAIGPTRAHWISDYKTTHCAEPGCGKLFDTFRTCAESMYYRTHSNSLHSFSRSWRHHCRRCGLVFCAAHSSHRLRLGPDARPSESGELSRVCAECLVAADDTHTIADVTKIGKITNAESRCAGLSGHWCGFLTVSGAMNTATIRHFCKLEARKLHTPTMESEPLSPIPPERWSATI